MPDASLGSILFWQFRDFEPTLNLSAGTFCVFLAFQLWLAKRRGSFYVVPRELTTDLLYWVIGPSFRVCSRAAALCALTWLALVADYDVLPAWLHGYGPVARQPRWLMMLELALLADLASYCTHRLMHAVPFLWRIHAVHHSSSAVRWHTTLRMHPLNDLITYVGNVVPALALGFPVEVLAPLLPLISGYALYSHCELKTDHGFLSAIVTSPRFHRWHHTAVDQGGNSNFAGLFSFWDRLFGSYYLPEDRLPERFGTDTDDMPESFRQQLFYPWRVPAPRRAAR